MALRHDSPLAAHRDRRLLGTLVSTALVFLAAQVPASSAETLKGTPRPDRLIGTARLDVLLGFGGKDYLEGRRGNDFLDGGAASDTAFAGPGADRLQLAFDAAPDRASCGPGRDLVTADLSDSAAPDCEVVSRQLSRDPFRGLGAQEGTEVEPDSFSRGSVVVAAFQVGRSVTGGALAIGYSTARKCGQELALGPPALALPSHQAGRSR